MPPTQLPPNFESWKSTVLVNIKAPDYSSGLMDPQEIDDRFIKVSPLSAVTEKRKD